MGTQTITKQNLSFEKLKLKISFDLSVTIDSLKTVKN